MNLEHALIEASSETNKKDILEILGITFKDDFENQNYYTDRINLMHKGKYFISDLDGTFFRGVLQKEAFTLFIKFVKKQNYLSFNIEYYYDFLKDITFFNELEKKAYNKQVEYFEYLNAGIYILLKHKRLVNWDDFLSFVRYNFKIKEKVTPFRFSFKKIKEILENGDNFIFVSGAPYFIFDIYMESLKDYLSKTLGKPLSNNVFGFGSNVSFLKKEYTPLWGTTHKEKFIDLLKRKKIISSVIGGMGDTSSDFGISYACDNGSEFYFINPEKKVIDNYDNLRKEGINYHLIIERKDLIFEFNKKDINFI